MTRSRNARTAFTYLEVTIVMVIAAIVTVSSLPDSTTDAANEADSAAERLQADIGFARSYSIAKPDDKVMIQADPPSNSYWIAREASPPVPITHPQTGKPYKVVFGSAAGSEFKNVTIATGAFGADNTLRFDSTGSVVGDVVKTLDLKAGKYSYTVSVDPVNASLDMVRVKDTAKVAQLTVPIGG